VVVLLQPSAHLAGLHPNYRIVSGRVPNWTLKEIHSDGALFQPLVVPLQPVPDHVSQKLLAPPARLKKGAVQDRVQFAKDGCFGNVIEGAGVAISLFSRNRICFRCHGIPHSPIPKPLRTAKPQDVIFPLILRYRSLVRFEFCREAIAVPKQPLVPNKLSYAPFSRQERIHQRCNALTILPNTL